MASLTDIAKDRVKGAGGEELNHSLIVAGRDMSEMLIDAKVTYNTDIGGSGIEFTVIGTDLQDYINAPMVFWIGYGEQLIPYFVGKIQQARPSENLNVTSAQAFGPYRRLVGQILRSQETFVGNTLEYVIMECFKRGGADLATVEVRNGRKYKVQEGEQFVYTSGLQDVINSVLEGANFVGMDLPGGKRLFLPTPRPGANVRHKTVYDPSEYYSFTITPKDEELYYSIYIFRRDESGADLFSVEQEIDPFTKFKPDRNKVLVVSDFPGDVYEAGDKAYEMAQSYRNGESSFSMSTAINPEMLLYDGFKTPIIRNLTNNKQVEERMYSCTIDDATAINYTPGEGNMEISGTSVELVRERQIRDIKQYIPNISPGMLQPSKEDKDWDSWDDSDVTFEEIDETWERL